MVTKSWQLSRVHWQKARRKAQSSGDGIDISIAGINYKKQLQRQKHTHSVLIMWVEWNVGCSL